MPSPFPGMDPFIESSRMWAGFHSKLINVCHELILERLPPGYLALVGEDVRLTDLEDESPTPAKTFGPDVLIARDPAAATTGLATASNVGTLEPVTLRVPGIAEIRNEWIEIRHRPDDDLVTVIEIQSPSNKENPGFSQHQSKRASHVYNGVNFVDIDLLTKGMRPKLTPPIPPGDYVALVYRVDKKDFCDAYAWSVRRTLPEIPIPLRASDPSVPLNLASAVNITYDRGKYERSLRYDRPLDVKLAPADRNWAAAIGANAARR